MDPSDVHPDLLGEALSRSGQQLAQLASLLTSWAMVEARRRERRDAAKAARSDQELRELREQERAAWQLARAGWAPAADRQWLASAGLVEVARAWNAAAAYADADPDAATALARCEDRLRHLHPYAMSWYDRQRVQGAALFDAMQDALPLFARAPHVRPGGPAVPRPALAATADAPATAGTAWEREQLWAAGTTASSAAGHDTSPVTVTARGAAGLAAESFPWTAADAVRAAASGSRQDAARQRVASAQPRAQRGPVL
jgi:hypothetical protein